MGVEVIILMVEAIVMYLLVLGAHSLRRRFGPVHFYALLGGITAIMSWVTDAGLSVSVGNITFVVGSTVFYTSLLLGVFVVYVFDGPKATRIAISTVMAVSILMPLIAAVLRFQMGFSDAPGLVAIPSPSPRINTASVIVTFLDLIFLAIAWEFLGKTGFHLNLWFRTWLTLLGVMWVDVLLFATGAFAGTPQYLSIMQGTLVSRFIISLFSLPFLYGYLHWQSKKEGQSLKNRPVLAILKQVAEIEAELSLAQREIKRRRKAEEALRESERKLRNIVEHSTNLFYSHTPDHQLTYLSPQVGTFFGLEPEDAGIRWMELATDNPVNEIGFAHTERAIKTGKASPRSRRPTGSRHRPRLSQPVGHRPSLRPYGPASGQRLANA